jgi:hypothetical protein
MVWAAILPILPNVLVALLVTVLVRPCPKMPLAPSMPPNTPPIVPVTVFVRKDLPTLNNASSKVLYPKATSKPLNINSPALLIAAVAATVPKKPNPNPAPPVITPAVIDPAIVPTVRSVGALNQLPESSHIRLSHGARPSSSLPIE